MKIWLALLIIVIFVISGTITVFIASSKSKKNETSESVKKTAIKTPENTTQAMPLIKTATVDLTFQPASASIRTGQTTTYDVMIDTYDFGTAAIQLSFLYDPKLVSIEEVTPGTFLQSASEMEKNIDPEKKTISYTLISLEFSSGQGVVATIKVKPLAPSKSAGVVQFDQTNTKIALKSKSDNTLYTENATKIVFHERPLTILP